MDRSYQEHCDEIEAQRIADSAATDAEWDAHWNAKAPRVGDQAIEFLPFRLRYLKPGEPLPTYLNRSNHHDTTRKETT